MDYGVLRAALFSVFLKAAEEMGPSVKDLSWFGRHHRQAIGRGWSGW